MRCPARQTPDGAHPLSEQETAVSVQIVPVEHGFEVHQDGDCMGFAVLRSTAEEMAANLHFEPAPAPARSSWCPECANGRRVRDPITDTYAPCPNCTCCECGKHVTVSDACSECVSESGWLLHNRCCDGD